MLFGAKQPGATGSTAGFLIGATLKNDSASATRDFDPRRRLSPAIVVSHPAGDAAELAERPLAAAVADAALSHFLLIRIVKKFK